jgi:hypothetical protein
MTDALDEDGSDLDDQEGEVMGRMQASPVRKGQAV